MAVDDIDQEMLSGIQALNLPALEIHIDPPDAKGCREGGVIETSQFSRGLAFASKEKRSALRTSNAL